MKDITQEAEFVGDFRNGYIDFGWDNFTPEEKASKRGIELNNGRAAQLGILGLMVHEGINNNPYVLNDILGSPVAFNAGFWTMIVNAAPFIPARRSLSHKT